MWVFILFFLIYAWKFLKIKRVLLTTLHYFLFLYKFKFFHNKQIFNLPCSLYCSRYFHVNLKCSKIKSVFLKKGSEPLLTTPSALPSLSPCTWHIAPCLAFILHSTYLYLTYYMFICLFSVSTDQNISSMKARTLFAFTAWFPEIIIVPGTQ